MLDEGVVAEAQDIDLCLITGAGWPFHLGGITPYLDREGVSERVNGKPVPGAGRGERPGMTREPLPFPFADSLGIRSRFRAVSGREGRRLFTLEPDRDRGLQEVAMGSDSQVLVLDLADKFSSPRLLVGTSSPGISSRISRDIVLAEIRRT